MRMAGDALMFGDMHSPNFDQIGAMGMQSGSMQRQAKTQSEAFGVKSDINAAATVDMAKAQAGAIRAGGQAQGQASMASGIGSMISGIAGGFGSMGTSAGATPASTASPSLTAIAGGNMYDRMGGLF